MPTQKPHVEAGDPVQFLVSNRLTPMNKSPSRCDSTITRGASSSHSATRFSFTAKSFRLALSSDLPVVARRTLRAAPEVALRGMAGILAIFALFGFNPQALAASETWSGSSSTDGNWSDTANWVGGAAPGSTTVTTNTDIATFNTAITNNWGLIGTPIVIDQASQDIGGISFDTNAGNYYIGSTTGNSLLLTSGGTIQILSTYAGTNGVETINAPLVIEGTGGTYTFANNSGTGSGAGDATLDFGGNISAASGNAVLTLGGVNANANTLSGTISNGSATTLGVTVNGAGSAWTLSGANTYTGPTTITNGTLKVANSAALQDSVLNYSAGTLSFGSLTSATVGGLSGSSSLPSSSLTSLNINLNSSATLTYTGSIGGGSGMGLTVTSADNAGGTQLLTGAGGVSTYTGNTTINGPGTLELNYAATGAPTSGMINSGSVLVMSGDSSSPGNSKTAFTTAVAPGGTLNVTGNTSNTDAQTFASTTLNAGVNFITTGGDVALNLGTITPNAGGSVYFTQANATSTTNYVGVGNSNDSTGILGGWAVYNGTGWASVNGSHQIITAPSTAYTTLTANNENITTASLPATTNLENTTNTYTGTTMNTGVTAINSLVQHANANWTITIPTGATLELGADGGILDTNGNWEVIVGATAGTGDLTAGSTSAGGTIYGDQDSTVGGLVINSVIENNPAGGPVTVVIGSTGGFGGSTTGGNNAVAGGINGDNGLQAANTYTGGTYLEAGVTSGDNLSAFGTGTVYVANGAQAYLGVGSGTWANNFNIAGAGDPNSRTVDAGAIVIAANTTTLSGNITLADDASIYLTTTGDTISGNITGTGNLTFAGGAGAVSLTNATNNFAGNLFINNTEAITVSGAGALNSGSYAGNIAFASTGSLNFTSSAAQTLSGAITGPGSVTENSTTGGSLTLSGSLTYTGGTTLTAGTLNLSSDPASVQNATFTFNGGTLNLGGLTSFAVGGLAGNGGTFPSSVTSLILNLQAGQNPTYLGALANGSGALSLTVQGSSTGIETLYGTDTYTGTTSVNGGFLDLGSNLALNDGNFSSASVAVASGAILGARIGGTGFASANSTIASLLSIPSSASTGYENGSILGLDLYNGSYVATTPITNAYSGGALGLNLSSAASGHTLYLNGANTYTGNTSIGAGTTLWIGSLGYGGAGSLGSGSYAGNIANAGTLVYGSQTAQALSGVISGSGGVQVQGPGTVTLSNANTDTGTTTLGAGTLNLNFGAGTTSTNIISSSSALSLGGGTLLMTNPSGGGDMETVASTTFTAGESVINVGSGTTLPVLNLKAMTENVGGAVEFIGPATIGASNASVAATGVITTTNAFTAASPSYGIVDNAPPNSNASNDGVYGTVGLYDWASVDTTGGVAGTSPYTIIGGSQVSGFYTSTYVAGGNWDLPAAGGTYSTTSGGTVRFNTPSGTANTATVLNGGGANISLSGVLVTPNMGIQNAEIYNGSFSGLYSSTGGLTEVQQIWQNDTSDYLIYNATFTAGRGSTPEIQNLVQNGPGTVQYLATATNTDGGSFYLNNGYSLITANGDLGYVSGTADATLYLNGGTVVGNANLALDDGGGVEARPITLLTRGGGFAAAAGDVLTIDGQIGSAAVAGPLIIGIPNSTGLLPGSGTGTNNTAVYGTGTVLLDYANNTNGNFFYGGVDIVGGATLRINSQYDLGGADYDGGITFNNGTLQYATPSTLATGAAGTALDVSVGGNGAQALTFTGNATIDVNGNAITFADPVGNGGSGAFTVESTQAGGSLTLNGNNNFTGGVTLANGKLAFGGNQSFTGPVAVTSGTMTFNGSNVYTGNTSVNGGKLQLNTGASLANTAVTVASGATLGLTGNTLGTTGATLTLNGGSTLNLEDGSIDTVTLNSTSATGSGAALTIGDSIAPAKLYFDINTSSNTSDELLVNEGTTAFGADGGKFYFNDLSASAPSLSTNYVLVNDPSGLPSGGFTLGTTALDLGGTYYALTLSTVSNEELLSFSIANLNYYYTGAGTSTTSSWSDYTNFDTAYGPLVSGTAQNASLNPASNVFLTNTGATNTTPETLDAYTEINSLSFTADSGSITINAGTGGSGTLLQIDATNPFADQNSNNYVAGIGLVTQSGAPNEVINANINLGNSQTWELDSSNSLTINGVIANGSSADALTKTGVGTLILTNNNTYSGGTIVSNGTIQLGTANALLAAGTLVVGGTSGTPTFDLNGNNQQVASLSDGGYSNGVLTDSGAAATFTTGFTSPTTYSGAITGSLALSASGSSTFTVSGSNSYTGLTTLSGGTLVASNNAALGNSTASTSGLLLNPVSGVTSTVDFTSATPSIGSLASSGAGTSGLVLGTLAGSGSSTLLTVGGAGQTTSFSGVISDLSGSKNTAIGNLTVIGGSLSLGGADTYTGTTTASGGTLVLNNANALQDSTLSIGAGSVIYGAAQTTSNIFALTGTGNLALTNTAGTPAAVALTLQPGSGSATYTGNLSGLGSLSFSPSVNTGTEQIGSGTTGGASYAGTTSVNEGNLIIGGTSSLTGQIYVTANNGNSSLTIQDDAVVNSAHLFVVGSSGSAGSIPNASLTVSGTGSLTVSGAEFGNGNRPDTDSITVAQSGTLTDNGALNLINNAGGVTVAAISVNLNGGTLGVQNFTESGNGTHSEVINFNGGTLEALGNDPTSSTFLPAFSTLTADVDNGGAIINTNGFNDTISQVLVHGTGTVDGGLTKNGSGILTDAINNTYNGATTVNAGTLVLSGTNSYAHGTYLNGGTLNINGLSAIGAANYAGVTFNGGTLQYVTSQSGHGGTDISTKPVTLSSGGATIDLNGNSVTYANAIGGSGGGGLTVASTASGGTLILDGANTYAGSTTINSGATLQLGDGTTGHDGAIETSSGITNNGTLAFNRAGASTSALAIGGSGNVTVSGAGSQTLTASSGYTGTTTVNSGGTLIVSGGLSATTGVSVSGALEADATIDTATTVNLTGGRLSGTGTVGAVDSTGGTIAAGDTIGSTGPGNLTANGTVTFDSASTFSIRLGVSVETDSDSLSIGANTINLGNATLALNEGAAINDPSLDGADQLYAIIVGTSGDTINGTLDYSGSALANGAQFTDNNGYTYQIYYGVTSTSTITAGNDVDLELVSVPEPGTWDSLMGGFVMLLVWQRSRRHGRFSAQRRNDA